MDISANMKVSQPLAQVAEPSKSNSSIQNDSSEVTKGSAVNADTVTISEEALQLLASTDGAVTTQSAGGTTLPTWPPKKQN